MVKKRFKKVVIYLREQSFWKWFQESLEMNQDFKDLMTIPVINFFPPLIICIFFPFMLIYWIFSKGKKEEYYEEI